MVNKKRTLGDIAELISTGKTPPTKNEKYFEPEINWYTPGDFKGIKYLKSSNRKISNKAIFDKKATLYPPETILITCIGNIGNVGILKQESSCNQQITAFKPKDFVSADFLYYWLIKHKYLLEDKSNSAIVPILNNKNLKTIKINYLPSLAEQKQIVRILDQAQALKANIQAQLEDYEKMGESLFLEMFGDPVVNPMGWESEILDNLGEIVSGVTKGRKLKGENIKELPYMRVANVQDGYLDLSVIKTIPGTNKDLEKYLLKKGDILLTEGGDPDKLGRGAVWNNEINNCIHQNHIFRVRLISNNILPLFFSKLCGSQYGKRYFLRSGKQTTGIASINKTQLKKFPILLPPLKLQQEYSNQVKKIKSHKTLLQTQLKEAEDLFQKLLQMAFKGELSKGI